MQRPNHLVPWMRLIGASAIITAIIVVTGLSASSTASAEQDHPQRAAPTEITASTGNDPGEIDITWKAHPHGATDYRVAWTPRDEDFKRARDTDWNAFPTDTSLTITGLQEGDEYRIKVRARFQDNPKSTWSPVVTAAAAQSPQSNRAANGKPFITGEPQVRQMLTADTTELHRTTFTYQWIVSDGGADLDITDATKSTYIPVDADEGLTIKVRVSFTDNDNNKKTLTSPATDKVAAAANAAPEDLAAPTNFRILNGTLTDGIWIADSNHVELDWDLPSKGLGNHLTKYWVRPEPDLTCPQGHDGGQNQDVIDGPCPLLTIYTEYGTRNTGHTDIYAVGLKYVYRIEAYQYDSTPETPNDRTLGEMSEITVLTPPLPPFVPTAVTGLKAEATTHGSLLSIKMRWNEIKGAPAYIIQHRKHDEEFDPSRNKINEWSGPQLYGADGKYTHTTASTRHSVRSTKRTNPILEYETLYHFRVGTCLSTKCDLADTVFTPEQSIRTPQNPR